MTVGEGEERSKDLGVGGEEDGKDEEEKEKRKEEEGFVSLASLPPTATAHRPIHLSLFASAAAGALEILEGRCFLRTAFLCGNLIYTIPKYIFPTFRPVFVFCFFFFL